MKQRLIPLIVLISLGGALLIGWEIWQKKYNHADELIVHGNVDIRQVDLGFRVSGRITEMRFEEGDLVKKGDVMAVLDKVPYQNELNSAKAQVSQAEADLSKKRTGNRPEEIQQAESTVKERQATYENALHVYERQQSLVKTGTASRQTYDNAVQQRDEARARLKNAKDTLKLMKEGFRSEDIAAAVATYELAKAHLAIAQTSLQDTDILAPSDGIVFSRIREPGAVVSAGLTVYTLSLHQPVWVRAYISEPDLGRIKPGMEANVYTDSHEKPFKGKVGFISPQAEFTPKNIETKELRPDLVYRIRILTEDPKGQLRQGMPVSVGFHLEPDN